MKAHAPSFRLISSRRRLPAKISRQGITQPASASHPPTRTGMYGGLRAKGDKADLALITCDTGAVTAGVFTLNVMCAAPVTYCKEVLAKTDTIKAVLVSPNCFQECSPTPWH